MLKGWKNCKISDLGTVVGGATPSTKNPLNYEGGSIPWITPKDLANFSGRYISRGERNITEQGLKSCSTQILPQHSVLFSSRAPIGYLAIAANDVCTNQGFKSVIPNDNTDYMFLYYLLKFNKNKIENLGSGTTFKEVSGSTMRGIEVCVPESLDEQQRIASILSVLDEKIERNAEINDNLLKQAQTIFNDFFVTFGHFGGIIPDYWEKGTLQDIVEFSNGYAFKSKELLNTQEPNSYHVFKQGHINRGGGFNSAGTKSWYPINKCTNLSKYILKKGDVLMAMTDMKDNVAILGNTALMTVDNQYIVNQHVGLLRSNKYKSSSYAYIYLLTNSFDFLKDLRSRANSGVQVNLSSSEIKSSPIWIASDEDNKEFNALVEPLLNIIMTNDIVNQKLSELRDSLLPKLMSGELDVSNINF